MGFSSTIALLSLLTLCASCSVSKPCSEAGDTSWPTPIKGDKRCTQKRFDGKYLNDGKYTIKDGDGHLLLDGQFHAGKKDGTWMQYDEKGNKLVERHFEDGVEVSGLPPPTRPPSR